MRPLRRFCNQITFLAAVIDNHARFVPEFAMDHHPTGSRKQPREARAYAKNAFESRRKRNHRVDASPMGVATTVFCSHSLAFYEGAKLV